jgi:hypothetical protein
MAKPRWHAGFYNPELSVFLFDLIKNAENLYVDEVDIYLEY